MSYLESFILGLVQGLGEFLPISSSAHLVIAPWFFDFHDPGLAFDVALHLGTLIAILFYFWKDWRAIAEGSFKFLLGKNPAEKSRHRPSWNMLWYLVVATVPGALAGVLLEDLAENQLRHPLLVAINMIVLGALLWHADGKGARSHSNLTQMTLKMAILIGASQALALFPGVSRSGITITTALLLGFSRTEAARFSFLLATPITFGACILKSAYFLKILYSPHAFLGVATAAIFGFLSIKYLMKLVQKFSYRIFCHYRFGFGIVVIVLYFWRAHL